VTREEIASALGLADAWDGYLPEFDLDLQGWNSESDAFDLVYSRLEPRIMVDVGVWKGGSTAALARKASRSGRGGYVVAVDTFLGSPEHWLATTHGDFRADLRFHHGMPRLYWQFMSNVCLLNLQDHVVPFAQTSTNAAQILDRLGFLADLIHVDAGHDAASLRQDLEAWWPLLRPGGVLIVDDYVDQWPSVRATTDEFARSLSLEASIITPKAVLFKAEE